MGFSTVVSGSLMLTAIAVSIALFVFIMSLGVNFLSTVIHGAAEKVEEAANVRLEILSASYGSELCFNVTNEGGEPVVLARGTIVLVDYVDPNGVRKVEVVPYEEVVVSRVFVDGYVVNVGSSTPVELAPNVVVELCTYLSPAPDTGKPLTIVLSTSRGHRAMRVVHLGG